MSGQITRKEIIEDEAIVWGPEYAKNVDLAVKKNKEFVDSILSLVEANNKLRGSSNAKELAENQRKVNDVSEKTSVIWKEQIQLENALISTKKKNQLATEGTNKKLIEERLLLAQTNAEIKKQTLERLGLVGAYTKLSQARNDAKIKLRDLIVSEKASTAEIRKAQVEFDKYDAKVRKADKAVGDFSKNVGNYKSAFSGLSSIFSAFGVVGGITAFATITKDIFQTSKELQSLDLALKSVTGSQAEMNKQQQFLNRISQDYGLEINNLTKQFTSFYVAAKGKLAGKEIQEIFENISKAGSALGLSNETLERSFQAVNQMLSKGTVASEELRGQLAESLPGAVQAMTKAVQKLHPELKNLTEKDLFQMIKDGKILANEVLPETARQLVAITGADKASGVDTLAKSTNRLSNEWTAFVRELTEGNSTVTKVFIGTINLLKDLLQGTTLLLESSADARKRTIEKMKSSGYDDILKASNKLSIDELTNMKKYNEQKIKENANTINAILEENKRLATDGTIGGAERYNRIQENKQKVQEINNLSYYLIGQNKATSEIILENETKSTKKKKQLTDEELKALEDLAKKRLLLQREVLDSEYELQKQRLERRIKLNDDVAKDEAELDSVRITAVENSQKEQERLLILNKNHLLEIEKLSYQKELEENKGSKANIALVEKNYVNNKLKINEDFSNKLIDLNQKTKEDIDKINQFDFASYQASLDEGVKKNEIAMNSELAAENERFKALQDLGFKNEKEKEDATRSHEQRLFDIKKEFAIATANLQLANLEAELSAFKAQSDGSKESNKIILETEKKLSEARLKLTELGLDNFKGAETEKVLTAKEQAEKILQISQDLTGALSDLGNAFSQAKIQKIDDEISKNNEFYDKQIALAENDARKKDFLEKERARKNDILEKKKREEQRKQAVFNKAVTIAEIGLKTALAIISAAAATAPTFWGVVIASAIGALQLGAALATPIPKYKHGRKGGPAELAIVGDGGVSEIITSGDGSNPRLTPNVPTLTKLGKDDIVHKSMSDYENYVKQSIILNFKNENQKIKELNSGLENGFSKEILEEMKRNTKAIEKGKPIILGSKPIDIPHSIWAFRNINWRA